MIKIMSELGGIGFARFRRSDGFLYLLKVMTNSSEMVRVGGVLARLLCQDDHVLGDFHSYFNAVLR